MTDAALVPPEEIPEDAPVLLLHASRFGQSVAIAEAMAARLEASGWRCRLARVQDALARDLSGHRAVVLVASIRYGHFDPAVLAFVARHAAALSQAVGVFVSVNLTARKPGKRTPQTNVYTRKFLQAAAAKGWQPDFCEVVAGALRYPRYNGFDRRMIQLIMRLTGGETDTRCEVEYTDWAQVEALAGRIAERLRDGVG
ncbi:MAG: menaquinone-dependent protoporphyrinogen IX dehydrogenase [Comamonas sp.]